MGALRCLIMEYEAAVGCTATLNYKNIRHNPRNKANIRPTKKTILLQDYRPRNTLMPVILHCSDFIVAQQYSISIISTNVPACDCALIKQCDGINMTG